MKASRRIFVILGVLLVVAIGWYFLTTHNTGDLQLIGTVDANEVVVSSRIPGLLESLDAEEGQKVQAGQQVATIQSQDLEAARNAARATAESDQFKLQESRATERQTSGQTSSQVTNAEAQLRVARASLAQAQAQYEHQKADTTRTVALAKQGVMSAQSSEEAETSLNAAQAAVDAAKESVSAAEASLKVAIANTYQAQAAVQTTAATRADLANAQALLDEADVELGYSKVVSPVTGIVDTKAARLGEYVAAGTPIITVVDLTQTWVYAPLPETQADAVQLGDTLRVVMPSGAAMQGKVIAKLVEADFATQRDVSRMKRDIQTIQLKLLIDNPGMRYVPGMTAEVYIPRDRLVKR
ncbi:HlyD family secretion protein [Paracidobacterium acidisoli]|nr:efflux RND transporter periplasmic adaptor subunit [Paracidobacterium acidisoli]MBT9331087.1 efflux RND transporter periplasmic adaptor subunit [Paracidobacterium acidisoli]